MTELRSPRLLRMVGDRRWRINLSAPLVLEYELPLSGLWRRPWPNNFPVGPAPGKWLNAAVASVFWQRWKLTGLRTFAVASFGRAWGKTRWAPYWFDRDFRGSISENSGYGELETQPLVRDAGVFAPSGTLPDGHRRLVIGHFEFEALDHPIMFSIEGDQGERLLPCRRRDKRIENVKAV